MKKMRILSLTLLLCVACGDDTTTPPFDAGRPTDAGPLLDGGPLDHPGFECTVSTAPLVPDWIGTVAGGLDVAVVGGAVFADPTSVESGARVVIAAGDHLEVFDPSAQDPTSMDTLTSARVAGDFGGASGLWGQADGLFVTEQDADRVQVLGNDLGSVRSITANGGFGGARAVAVDASGRALVAGAEDVRITTGGASTVFADASYGTRGDVAPLALALDESRDRIYVAAEAGIEVFTLGTLAHVARIDAAGTSGVAVDRFGFVYLAVGTDLVVFHPESLLEVDRFDTGLSGARVAIGASELVLLGSDGSVAGYGLGAVQSHACIARMRVITPPRMVLGHLQQVRVEIDRPDGAIDRMSFRRAGVASIGAAASEFFMYSGVGVANVVPSAMGAATVTLRAMGFSASADVDVVAAPAGAPLTGALTNLDWGPEDGVIHIGGTATVPAGSTLTMAPGTMVLMDADALLVVEGDLSALGTAEAPITIFGAPGGETWSQIHHRGAGGNYAYRHVFIAGGGNHADAYTYRRWKHCCPPVLYVETGTFVMEQSVIGDTPNKAFLISDGSATLSGCAVQRVGMGPEFEATTVRVNDVWVSEVRGIDDNDGIYFWKVGQCCSVPTDVCTISCGAPYPQTSVEVDGLVMADGDDDGIDTQMSFASVGGDTHPMSPILRNVLIYGWADKGMSLAGGNAVMQNVLSVQNRNLGIKADDNDPRNDDYPDVLFRIERSTIADNVNYGLFFGVQGGMTEFGDGSHMTMSVSDSIVFGNATNAFRQYDVSTFAVSGSDFPGAIGTLDNVIDADPLFIDPARGDYRVSPLSAASQLVGGRPAGFTEF